MSQATKLVVFLLVTLLLSTAAFAGIPQLINYQGRLTNSSGQPLDTTVQMIFSFYTDSTGGTPLWADTIPNAEVVEGLFTSQASGTPGHGFWGWGIVGDSCYLGIKVGNDPEITPRTRLTSAPFAFHSAAVDGFHSGPKNVDSGLYTLVAGDSNTVLGDYGSITGGYGNRVEPIYLIDTLVDTTETSESTIDEYEVLNGEKDFDCPIWPLTQYVPGSVGGGWFNLALGSFSKVTGGYCNWVFGGGSIVGGGIFNKNFASGHLSFIGGGLDNHIEKAYSVVAGGWYNRAYEHSTVIGGGSYNSAYGRYSTIGGGKLNKTSSSYSAVVGGYNNYATALYAFAGGGKWNRSDGNYGTIGGGLLNKIVNTASCATIGGGDSNYVAEHRAGTIAGGEQDTVLAKYGTAGGGKLNFVGYDALYGTAAGGYANTVKDEGGTIGGGGSNISRSAYSTVGGGLRDSATAPYSTVGGGLQNWAREDHTTIGGGVNNQTSADSAVISGGINNTAAGLTSTIGGGSGNLASGNYSTIGGGNSNEASGTFSTIPGGYSNLASGAYSFSAGYNAEAGYSGSFVWSDNSGGAFASTNSNQFLIRASGGVGIGTNAPVSQLHVSKAISTTGEGAVTVNFSNSVGSIGARGINIESTQLVGKGSQMGLIGKTSIDYATTQAGSAEGRVAEVAGYDAYGAIAGISGTADFSYLDNYSAAINSYGLGGKFVGRSTAGITLDATGTYYIGGVHGEVSGAINAASDNAVVAGVIGVDKATGTSYHRAAFFDGIMRLKPMARPASPLEGDIYVDSGDHHIYCYCGAPLGWKQLDN